MTLIESLSSPTSCSSVGDAAPADGSALVVYVEVRCIALPQS